VFNTDTLGESQAVLLEHLNLVFIGHVDHGKSTLAGRILLELEKINTRTIEKNKQKAKENHRENSWLTYFFDTDETEQKNGRTVEFSRGNFHSSSKRYTILDAPGHRNYVPMMIEGTSQADVGILVVSARASEFEAGFQKSGQTREHIILAKTFGVKHLIVVVNKMDDPTVSWDFNRFKYISDSIRSFLTQVGYTNVPFIPISAYQGINICNDLNAPSWYKQSCLIKTLDSLSVERDVISPVVISIVSSSVEQGQTYAIAKILKGKVRLNQRLISLPSRQPFSISGLYLSDEVPTLQEAGAGENLRISFHSPAQILPKGSVLCADEASVVLGSSFIAEIQLLQLPPSFPLFTAGFRCVAHIGGSVVDVEVRKLLVVWEKNKTMKKNPAFVKSNRRVGVVIDVVKPVPFQVYEQLPDLGRITLRIDTDTIGFGKIDKAA
jgi:peptide chain release factor subunit 3